MLIRIIAQYLETHRRLIIPQMGAFIVKEPGSSVLFSELLKRDDGALRALLVAGGVPELEAAGEIDRFVFEARHAVQQGQEFPLAGLGVLKPGPNGTIAFAYDPQVGREKAASAPAGRAGTASADRFGNAPDLFGTVPARPSEPGGSPSPVRPAVSTSTASASTARAGAPAPTAPSPTPEESESARKLASAVRNLYGDSPQPAQPLRTSRPAQPVRSEQPLQSARPAQQQAQSEPEEPKHSVSMPSMPPSRFQLASKKLKRDELFADSYYGRLPRRPAIEQTVRVKKRSDHFIWIALIAALIALAAIAFGEWSDSFGREDEEFYFEQPAHDLSPETMPEAF